MLGFNKETITEIEKIGFKNDSYDNLRCLFHYTSNPEITILLGQYPNESKDGAYVFLWSKRDNKGNLILNIDELKQAVNKLK